jgi:4-hydroxybenzoate polyprenyltransferase
MFASFYFSDINGDLTKIFWNTIIPACLSLAILNGASNTLNQAADFKSDNISKSYRPIPRGMVSINQAKILSIFLYIFSIFISITVNIIFSIIVIFIVIFTITYSLPPRFKDFLFFNQLWVAIPRGLLGVLASWSVFANPFQSITLAIGFIAMLFLIGGSITKDIIDSDADKKTGTKTLINTYGIKKAALISLPFLFFPFILVPFLINNGILGSYLWILTFLSIPGFFIFYLMIRDDKRSLFFENTSAWTLMYLTYFLFAFSFSVLTVINSIL